MELRDLPGDEAPISRVVELLLHLDPRCPSRFVEGQRQRAELSRSKHVAEALQLAQTHSEESDRARSRQSPIDLFTVIRY